MLDGLQTNLEKGLKRGDFTDRENHFGSNYRAPPDRTPFCKLFLNALEDFMLRLLLVCACISIVLDVSFAEHSERGHGKYLVIDLKI